MSGTVGGPREIPVLWKRCARCAAPFQGISKAIYCSNACRVAAYRERRKAEESKSE